MKRLLALAAALALAPSSGSAAEPEKPGPALANPEPRNPESPLEPPAPSGAKPLPGKPAPVPAPANEGTGRATPARTDAEIASAVAAALREPSAPRVDGLTISVKGGRATLKGTVRSVKEKDVVTAKAGAAAGLRNVRNEIAVAP